MQENNIDLLNLSQPWDCERFPKSKTICYGGGGGGGGGNPVKKVTKAVSSVRPKITTPKITTPKVTVPSVVDIKKGVSDTVENIKSGTSSTIESVKSDIAKSDIGRGISSTVESVKSDIARSDLGSGAIEEAIKRSDVGIVTEQAKDVLNAPGIYVGKKLEEFKKYAKDRLGMGGDDDSGSSGASTGSGPGTGATIGAGGTSGLRAGAQMKSGRQRAKQNKRALRISRRS